MAGALPVAGVGLGDQHKFGFPRIENAACQSTLGVAEVRGLVQPRR